MRFYLSALVRWQPTAQTSRAVFQLEAARRSKALKHRSLRCFTNLRDHQPDDFERKEECRWVLDCSCLLEPACEYIGIPTFPPGHIPVGHSPPGQFPAFLDIVGHSPFHNHHPPIYNAKRSTINVYKIDTGRSVRVRNTD